MLEHLRDWTALVLSLASLVGAGYAYQRAPAAACTPVLVSPIAPEETPEMRVPEEDDAGLRRA